MRVFLRAAILTALPVAGILASASNAHASMPMGVYARVDSVSYEPDKATATKVKINGVFALHQGGSAFDYGEPQAGYMYFECPAGKENECREQWNELESYAGSKTTCAGFGQQEKAFGTVRAEGTVAQPETYELGLGVTPGQFVGGTCPKLLAYTSSTNSSSGASGAGSGETTSGDTTNPPSGGTPTGEAASSGSDPSPPPAPSSSSSCAATPGATGSALAFAAVAGAIVGFFARRKKR